MTTQEVLEKHFRGERTKYFQQSDAHQAIEGSDVYLRYHKDGGIQLWMGGDSGEVCVLHTRDGDVLERTINLLINAQ